MTQTLEERMVLAQQGDSRAYADLLQEVTRIVRGYLRRKILDDSDLEDVVQEVLVSVHKARHTYDGKRPFKPWVMAIATYRLNDHLRKYYRSVSKDSMDYADMEHQLSEDVTEDSEYSELLEEALASLPEKQRQIVYMMKVDGYTAKEVADKLGMGVSAVKVSAHRSYKVMKKNILKAEAEEN